MIKIKHWILAAAGFLMVIGTAFAQGVPTTILPSPTGSEIATVQPVSGPLNVQVYLRQMRDAVGYSKQSPSTDFTLTFATGQSQMQIGGASTLAAGTINLTASPVDGQINCFYTKPIVTALTLAAASGQTVNDAVTATTATTRYCYLYSLSNLTWDRIQ